MGRAKYFDGNKFILLGEDTIESLGITKEFIESLGINKASMGLDKVDNVKQMPVSGGDFTGVAKAKSGNDGSAQLRNVIFSTENPEDEDGEDGDIWFVYSEAVE